MRFFDVTVPIAEDVPLYGDDPPVTIEPARSISTGDAANVSYLRFGAHTVTHVDAPNHFIEGSRRVDKLDLGRLIGHCEVIEIDDLVRAIEPEHLPSLDNVERVLFKTRNSSFWGSADRGFRSDFAFITPATASLLVESGVKLVGIDYLSIEEAGAEGHPVHMKLLENEVVILEGLDLSEVPPGKYELICLPLKYIGGTGDGAPARTILRSIHQ